MTPDEETSVRAAIEAVRRRAIDQIASLDGTFASIVEGAELTSTDDEHDPEGATIAYERAQVAALLRQARADVDALAGANHRLEHGTLLTCAVCRGPIVLERVLALPMVQTCVRCAP